MGRNYTGIPQDLISSVLPLLVLFSAPLSCLATLQDLSLCVCVHVCMCVCLFMSERSQCAWCVCLAYFSFSSYVLHIMSDTSICYVSKDFLSWHQMFGIIDQRDSERLGRCAQHVRVWDKSGSERESQLCCLPTEPRSPHPDSWKINKEGKANEKKQKGPFVAPGEVSFKRRSHSTEPWSKAWLR